MISEKSEKHNGLVLCDKSHRRTYELTVQADICTIRSTMLSNITAIKRKASGGARKPIKEFTKKSRNNMMRTLAKVRGANAGLFIHLTYPDEALPDVKKLRRDRDVFFKRMRREYPAAAGVWRVEFEDRKSGQFVGRVVPHIHVLLFQAKGYNLVRMIMWVALAWFQVVGSGLLKHLKAGTRVERINSRRHAMYYASKYVAKSSEHEIPIEEYGLPGRFWGVFGELDRAIVLTVKLTQQEYIKFKRLAVRWLKSKRSGFAGRLARAPANVGCSIFGLGDRSFEGWHSVMDSTVAMMLLAL